MECPNCGAPETARVKICPVCNTAYASIDLVTLRQLEFLVRKTAAWGVPESLRAPYVRQLEELRARLVGPTATTVEPEAATEPEVAAGPEIVVEPSPLYAEATAAVSDGPAAVAVAGGAALPVAAAGEPMAPTESVPFDQWLLSERNIKFALYGGGLLLVIAGMIFVGVNWTRIPGPGKFAITLMVTGLMFLGGYLLHHRPTYRLGGIALLGISCGFLALNFAVLQLYVLGPAGLRDDVMWLIASPLCLLAYLLIGHWTRADLFVYISLGALASTAAAALVVVGAAALVYAFIYALLVLVILGLSLLVRPTAIAEFAHQPLLFVSQGGMPVVLIYAVSVWVDQTGCSVCPQGTPWLAILTLATGVAFYGVTERAFRHPSLAARWVAIPLFSVTVTLALIESGVSDDLGGLTLMVLALIQLGAGYWLEQRGEERRGALPLYVTAAALALFVTTWALADTDALIKVLLGDVVLLAAAAWVFRKYHWIYGAVWLFMVPMFMLIDRWVIGLVPLGLLMGVLGLNYVAAGYALGNRQRRLAGPFLTAAVAISALVPGLVWGSPVVASLTLALVAALYVLAATWLGWTWLLLPALGALDLVVLAVNRAFYPSFEILDNAVVISTAVAGALMAGGALALRRQNQTRWAWPLYLVGAVNLGLASLIAFVAGGWLAAGVLVFVGALLLGFSWWERTFVLRKVALPLLSFLGIGLIFGAHLFVLDRVGAPDVWPSFTAGVCALLASAACLLRSGILATVYGTPLRVSGLVLFAVPMVGAVVLFDPALGAIVFGIAALTYAADAAVRRLLNMLYLALGTLVVVIWAILLALDISNPQAYVIPLGLALLGAAWNEHQHERSLSYVLPTILGLLVLLGTSFIQSLQRGGGAYALLLLVESLIALGWGVLNRVRWYCNVGGTALLANAIAQLGPGILELSRWIQIGLTGAILLGGGLLALFKRQEILSARQSLSQQWRQWDP